MTNDPSFIAFARSNVLHNRDTTPVIVKKLLDEIDKLQRKIDILEDSEDD